VKDYNWTPEAIEAIMVKAETACASARLLLESGDQDGAANRAYYAMFDAAHAVLLACGAPLDIGKTHHGLIKHFTHFLFKNAPEQNEFGNNLRLAFAMRCTADYDMVSITLDAAQEIVMQAEQFVFVMRSTFMPANTATEQETEDDDSSGPKP